MIKNLTISNNALLPLFINLKNLLRPLIDMFRLLFHAHLVESYLETLGDLSISSFGFLLGRCGSCGAEGHWLGRVRYLSGGGNGGAGMVIYPARIG